MRHVTNCVAVAIGLVVLAGCTTAPTTGPEPGPSVPGASDPTIAPNSSGRFGWRVTGTNVLGEWLPHDTCGGEYLFRYGVSLRTQESLTDLEGNDSYDGPSAFLGLNPEGTAWSYEWYGNINSVHPGWIPGAWVQGAKDEIEFAPDANGHPPAEVTFSGGWNTRVDSSLGTITERGVDWFTFRFERIPEPEECLELYEYDLGTEYEWEYYD
jgi:hypothetical protein